MGNTLKARFGGANWTREVHSFSGITTVRSQTEGCFVPSQPPPSWSNPLPMKQISGEDGRCMESWARFCRFSLPGTRSRQPLRYCFFCELARENGSKSNRINPATLARPSWKICEKVFYKLTSFGGRKWNRSYRVMGAPTTGFLLTVLSSWKATSQLMHKMFITGQGPGKFSLKFSRVR